MDSKRLAQVGVCGEVAAERTGCLCEPVPVCYDGSYGSVP